MAGVDLFFHPYFQTDLNWKGYLLHLGSVHPTNKLQISNALRDLSHESIRNRFLGTKKEFSENELNYLTVLDGWNHYAIGIEEKDHGGRGRGVGLIRLARSDEKMKEAEVAITIIDEYQNLGLGTLLLDMIILAAIERDIEKLAFTFLPQNTGIIKLISKAGTPVKSSSQKDYVEMHLILNKLNLTAIKGRLKPFLPSIDNFR
jgi:GNAT superfamily N-acetyltransferase